MALITNLPLEARLAALFVLGALVGGQINRSIYRLAWDKRDIGPWSKPDSRAAPRRILDYVPILGWFGLRRESSIHGTAFWLRPMLLELCFAFVAAWLYFWNVEQGGLIGKASGQNADVMLHCHWLTQFCLLALLTSATFIDFDEQSIPDEITVSGTILALVFAACLPIQGAQLPVGFTKPDGPALVVRKIADGQTEPLLLISPWSEKAWPGWLNGEWGLMIGVACCVAWCVAVRPPFLWDKRHGFGKAIRYLFAHMSQPLRKTERPKGAVPRHPNPAAPIVVLLIILGPIAVAAVWWQGNAMWSSLLSSLVGLAFGGGLIWAVRIIGTQALGKEAMGFGDVTLMAMIGAFVGWQPSLIIFFLAPLAAAIIAILQVLMTGKHEVAFGPYLALGTVILLLGWDQIWNHWAADIFVLGWLIPEMVLICLVLMAVMLLSWRKVKERIFKQE